MDRDQIEKRLPHAGSMVLLDRVISWSADEIVCGAHSHRDPANPLRTERGLSVLAGIEYAGQAIALHASLTGGAAPAGGVLAALRDVRWEPGDMAAWHEEIVVRARRLAASANAATYVFRLARGDREVLSGTALVAFRTSPG